MRYLILSDIEGVTGVTTYPQAEHSEMGRRMLMHDLNAVIDGIRDAGAHEIVVYDMHTDGRNVDMELLRPDVPVVMGKPILGEVYKGLGKDFDGLFMVGLHAMSRVPGALLAHSYLLDYAAIRINGTLVGEIGVEAALAGEQGIPLVFVSGDDRGCQEAEALLPGVVTASVKQSLDGTQALCYAANATERTLREAACRAARLQAPPAPYAPALPVTIEIDFVPGERLDTMRRLHPEIFASGTTARVVGDTMLGCWADYLVMEREMVTA